MLKYLIDTSERLTIMMVLLGMIFAYFMNTRSAKTRRGIRILTLLGIVASGIMTYLKIYTSSIDTSLWNLRIYMVSLVAFLVFLVGSLLKRRAKKAGTFLSSLALYVQVFALLFYYLPAVMETPHTILLTEKTVLSTNYLLSLIGMLFGIILTLVLGISVYKGVLAASKGAGFAALVGVLTINSLKYLGLSFGILLTKRMIATNHTLFVISKYTSNYSDWFIYLVLLLCVLLQIALLVKSAHVQEPYKNPAEHRKILAKWKKRRRWAVTTIVCSALIVLTLTVIAAYAGREVELSPIEEAREEDGNIYVSFDQVSDGKLHRFGYTTESGTVIRFIVIQKPNSSAYGIGLDACDICGETGYYEKDGQVICNLCDVVMNINTIGFKGGCNPIVIDYSIENGHIVVPIEGLLEHEKEFK